MTKVGLFFRPPKGNKLKKINEGKKKFDYVSFEVLMGIKPHSAALIELPSFEKVQSAKVAANVLKNRGVGVWSIHLITNNVIKIERKV